MEHSPCASQSTESAWSPKDELSCSIHFPTHLSYHISEDTRGPYARNERNQKTNKRILLRTQKRKAIEATIRLEQDVNVIRGRGADRATRKGGRQ